MTISARITRSAAMTLALVSPSLAIICALTAAAGQLTVLGVGASDLTPAPTISATPGAYAEHLCADHDAFAAWLGRPAASVYHVIFPSIDTIAHIDGTGGDSNSNKAPSKNICGTGQNLEVTVAMGTENKLSSVDSYANMIKGNDDFLYTELASQLVKYAPNAIVRLGWESNGNWYYWGLQSGGSKSYGLTHAQYVTLFRHFVTVMRAVPGTSGLRFNWNLSLCGGCANVTSAYPGDAYVDIIGVDAYEKHTDGTQSGFNTYWVDVANSGLAWQVAFAKAHNKQMSIDEWGVGENGGNDANASAIIPLMAAWMNNSGNVNGYKPYLYFDYFNTYEDGSAGVIDGEPISGGYAPPTYGPPYQLPLSSAVFLATFGGAPLSVASPAAGTTETAAFPVAMRVNSNWVNVVGWDSGNRKVCPDQTPANNSVTLTCNLGSDPFGLETITLTGYSVPSGQPGGTSTSTSLVVNWQ